MSFVNRYQLFNDRLRVFFGRWCVIVIKLKEAMLAYGRRNSQNLTFEDVSELTGIPTETLRSIGSRPGYHCSVARIEILCRALETPLHEMLELTDDPPKPKRRAKKKRPGGPVKR
ncbi:MAG: hypothetical protein GY778_04365 [bacterium]|nr:hypothetical protein [bacterium]